MPRGELKIEAPELRLNVESGQAPLDRRAIFGTDGPVEIEVGTGKGRFLLGAAELRPDVSHLGIEWANKYLRIAESRALRRGLTNVRFVRFDARELLPGIPATSIAAYYVFYPDPWPKARHHKRRFIQTETANELARTLCPGGLLHVATDHEEYWQAIVAVLDVHPEFARLATFGGPAFPLPVDEPLTNFEIKYGREGRTRNRASWQRRAP
jgi:tRNA (guanine-N7-)-methyltransferase